MNGVIPSLTGLSLKCKHEVPIEAPKRDLDDQTKCAYCSLSLNEDRGIEGSLPSNFTPAGWRSLADRFSMPKATVYCKNGHQVHWPCCFSLDRNRAVCPQCAEPASLKRIFSHKLEFMTLVDDIEKQVTTDQVNEWTVFRRMLNGWADVVESSPADTVFACMMNLLCLCTEPEIEGYAPFSFIDEPTVPSADAVVYKGKRMSFARAMRDKSTSKKREFAQQTRKTDIGFGYLKERGEQESTMDKYKAVDLFYFINAQAASVASSKNLLNSAAFVQDSRIVRVWQAETRIRFEDLRRAANVIYRNVPVVSIFFRNTTDEYPLSTGSSGVTGWYWGYVTKSIVPELLLAEPSGCDRGDDDDDWGGLESYPDSERDVLDEIMKDEEENDEQDGSGKSSDKKDGESKTVGPEYIREDYIGIYTDLVARNINRLLATLEITSIRLSSVEKEGNKNDAVRAKAYKNLILVYQRLLNKKWVKHDYASWWVLMKYNTIKAPMAAAMMLSTIHALLETLDGDAVADYETLPFAWGVMKWSAIRAHAQRTARHAMVSFSSVLPVVKQVFIMEPSLQQMINTCKTDDALDQVEFGFNNDHNYNNPYDNQLFKRSVDFVNSQEQVASLSRSDDTNWRRLPRIHLSKDSVAALSIATINLIQNCVVKITVVPDSASWSAAAQSMQASQIAVFCNTISEHENLMLLLPRVASDFERDVTMVSEEEVIEEYHLTEGQDGVIEEQKISRPVNLAQVYKLFDDLVELLVQTAMEVDPSVNSKKEAANIEWEESQDTRLVALELYLEMLVKHFPGVVDKYNLPEDPKHIENDVENLVGESYGMPLGPYMPTLVPLRFAFMTEQMTKTNKHDNALSNFMKRISATSAGFASLMELEVENARIQDLSISIRRKIPWWQTRPEEPKHVFSQDFSTFASKTASIASRCLRIWEEGYNGLQSERCIDVLCIFATLNHLACIVASEPYPAPLKKRIPFDFWVENRLKRFAQIKDALEYIWKNYVQNEHRILKHDGLAVANFFRDRTSTNANFPIVKKSRDTLEYWGYETTAEFASDDQALWKKIMNEVQDEPPKMPPYEMYPFFARAAIACEDMYSSMVNAGMIVRAAALRTAAVTYSEESEKAAVDEASEGEGSDGEGEAAEQEGAAGMEAEASPVDLSTAAGVFKDLGHMESMVPYDQDTLESMVSAFASLPGYFNARNASLFKDTSPFIKNIIDYVRRFYIKTFESAQPPLASEVRVDTTRELVTMQRAAFQFLVQVVRRSPVLRGMFPYTPNVLDHRFLSPLGGQDI